MADRSDDRATTGAAAENEGPLEIPSFLRRKKTAAMPDENSDPGATPTAPESAEKAPEVASPKLAEDGVEVTSAVLGAEGFEVDKLVKKEAQGSERDAAPAPDTSETSANGQDADAGTEPPAPPDGAGEDEDPLATASAALDVEGGEVIASETIERTAEHERRAEHVRKRATELAALSSLDYDVCRRDEAKVLGITLIALDAAVHR